MRSDNFLRLLAVCAYIFNFLRLLARRILNFLRFELLADKPQFYFFLPLACSCCARTSCATYCACIIFGLYCTFTLHHLDMQGKSSHVRCHMIKMAGKKLKGAKRGFLARSLARNLARILARIPAQILARIRARILTRILARSLGTL